MQSLLPTTKPCDVEGCAKEVLDAAPALLWYIRLHMRKERKGLSVPQFRALVKVRKQPGVSLSAVADHLGASLPTTSRVVAKLVGKRLLERRESNTDRRQVMLEITLEGRRLVDAATASTQAHMEGELKNLSAEEREKVRLGMNILKTMFGGAGFPVARDTETADAPRDTPEWRNGALKH